MEADDDALERVHGMEGASVINRVGQVWLGVHYENEADVCLCVRSVPYRDTGTAHEFLDMETGELGWSKEYHEGEWEMKAGRKRLT